MKLCANDDVIRIQAGANGSIQGPAEAKWGYTSPCVADWDHDGRLDLIVNSIWGRIVLYRNVGTSRVPKLALAQPIDVAWPDRPPYPAWNWWRPNGRELVTQWRTTPVVVDWNADKLNDLLMIDHEGYLAMFLRRQEGSRFDAFARAESIPWQNVWPTKRSTVGSTRAASIECRECRSQRPTEILCGRLGQ